MIIGGAFQNLASGPAYGLATVDPSNGAQINWEATATVRNAGVDAAILDLTTDGTYIYGNGYVFGATGNPEGTFSAEANTGRIRWIEDCHGDTYGNFAVGGVVYTVSLAHYCGNIGGYGESLPVALICGMRWLSPGTPPARSIPIRADTRAGPDNPVRR